MHELGFRFDEPAARSRHRPRAAGTVYSATPPSRRRQKRRRRRGRTGLALLMVVLLLGVLAGAGYAGLKFMDNYFRTPDYDGPGTGEVIIEIFEGQTATDIAYTLYENDVVASPESFIEAANADPASKNIQPGTYKLRRQMRAVDALALLLNPEESRVVELVTIPEGLTKWDTYKRLSEHTGIPVEEFEEAEEEVLELIPDEWFQRDDGKKAEGGLEGFLFPETYDFGRDATARSILEAMVNQFLAVAEELDFLERVPAERQISPYEALIAASIAQAEAGIESDMPKVTRVAYNRVYKAFMPLEMDVTTNYGLLARGEKGMASGDMTDEILRDPDNLYSTHAHEGWPPGPINSPGRAALEAAMEPADGDWLFFVLVDPETGESAFAVTNEEHEENKRIACQNGVKLGDC
jgi:UPF0755 protein